MNRAEASDGDPSRAQLGFIRDLTGGPVGGNDGHAGDVLAQAMHRLAGAVGIRGRSADKGLPIGIAHGRQGAAVVVKKRPELVDRDARSDGGRVVGVIDLHAIELMHEHEGAARSQMPPRVPGPDATHVAVGRRGVGHHLLQAAPGCRAQ